VGEDKQINLTIEGGPTCHGKEAVWGTQRLAEANFGWHQGKLAISLGHADKRCPVIGTD
jgi:hypothetical protein